MSEPKKNIKLSDGREITVNIATLKRREWLSFWDIKTEPQEDHKVIARLTGLKPEEIGDMLNDDFRRVMAAIQTLANRPLDDPNSPSASI